MYIHFGHEISRDNELYNNWYRENIAKLMPHLELEIELETTTGNLYSEKIKCGSGWDISMENEDDVATRSIGISEVSVKEI